jgi:hypothetical protein
MGYGCYSVGELAEPPNPESLTHRKAKKHLTGFKNLSGVFVLGVFLFQTA